jgi:2-dehydropantoate 2-reductase
MMRVLVVGAGAVGQVYGRALQRAGAELTFLVKPRHEAAARRGFVLYPWNAGRAPVRLEGFGVVTEPGGRYDAVVLALPSTATRAPGFLDELAPRLGDATVLSLQPGLDDVERLARHVPAGQIVDGLIGFMAYLAPLPGEDLSGEPGVAYWLPPLASCAVAGPRAAPIAQALRAGGLPSKVHEDVAGTRAFGGAVLEALVDGLEAAGWDLAALRADRALLGLVARAARESAVVAGRVLGVAPPASLRLLGPLGERLVLGLLRRLAPFDLAAFFRAHFTKIVEQRRALGAETRERARGLGLSTTALDALHARVDAAR